MPMVFGPSDDTASLISMILSLTFLNGPMKTSTTVSKHNPLCQLQMPTKVLSCKKEVICKHGAEMLWCPVGQGSFKMDSWKSVLWADKSKFDILVGNHGRRVLRAKEEGYLPACHQRSVQKPASLIGWGCISAYGMGSLHVLEGTMNGERYIKVLEQHMLPSTRHLFQGRPCVIQQDNAKPHTAANTTAWLHNIESGCWICLPAVQIFHLLRTSVASLNKNYVKDDNSSAAGNLYQARVRPNSNTKTPETHNLDAQTSSNCLKKRGYATPW